MRFFDWYEKHRETHRAYVATIDGKAVGCAWLVVVERIPGPEKFVRRAGMVQSVYVQPVHRNAGVGTKLVESLISDARTMALDYLTTHPTESSLSYYRRLGFDAADRALERDPQSFSWMSDAKERWRPLCIRAGDSFVYIKRFCATLGLT